MSITLLIAVEQRLFRQSLRMLLEHQKDFAVVAEAADGRAAFDLTLKHKPDLAIMDVDLPHLDGVTATKLIHGCLPDTKVLVLSDHDEDARIVAAVQAGAFGYVLMDADHTDFVRIIRATKRGEHVLSPFVSGRSMRSAVATTGQVWGDVKALLPDLTDREREILACAAAGRSNKEIADQLCVSIETVKTHLHHIYHKLSVHGRVDAVLAYLQAK
jgi:DNA-binding NarL/FixJ family response regulator